MYRILFTSVGRRVELMQAFLSAARAENIALQIYGADMSMSAPALMYCHKKVQVCRISDSSYIPQLVEICKREKIDLLIPTIDTDLLLLAQNKRLFEEIGTRVLISDPDKIKICRDKRYTAAYFEKCGLHSPEPVDFVDNYQGTFPCFIKPKDGSSSIHAYRVESAEELREYAERVPDYIIQPFIEGREYTIDIFCDFNGDPVFITPRERLAVRSGEVLKTQIVQDARMIEESRKLIADYKPCGPITVQLIRQKETQTDYFIEINPRFGGGAPLSMKAGADAIAKKFEERFGKSVGFGIGVNCGNAVVGNIGCDFRMDYTAIGDTVNTAARLESNAKRGQILISKEVYEAVKDRVEATPVGEIPLKGKTQGVFVYQLDEVK